MTPGATPVCDASQGYDALNRPLKKSYSGTPTTADVIYHYDGSGAQCAATSYATGRLSAISSGTSSTTYCFDPLGRVTASQQTTDGVPYPFTYAYNLAGDLTSMGLPSGRSISYARDVLGRITKVSGTQPGGGTAFVYAGDGEDAIQYWAHGPVKRMALHNGVVEQSAYNPRLQPTSITASKSNGATPVTLLSLGYTYPAGTSNNGNIATQTIAVDTTIPGDASTVVQTYSYDGFNRLASAVETRGEPRTWQQVYAYDVFGNRALKGGDGYHTPGGSWTPQVPNGTVEEVAALFTGNRQNSNIQYDGGVGGGPGNVTALPGYTFTYDAENRISKAVQGGIAATEYSYDGEGRRVMRTHCASNVTACTTASEGVEVTVYAYDAMGNLAAEYGGAASAAPCATCYLTADHLGSTRMVTAETGSLAGPSATDYIVKERHDFLPFGEEILASEFGRNALYGGGGVKQKFTGKERDAETGLDYFGARYYSAAQGRWTSPDPTFLGLTRLVNPQRWNLYGYALNNPFRYVDPDGRDAMYVVFKDYKASIMGIRAYATGHAGMVVVDRSGHTTYREYGRYDTNQGETRSQNVPNLQMDANGHPTDASMQALIETMSKENQNGSVDVIYYDTTDDVDTLLLKELARRMAENKDPKRPPYTLEHHNCGTLFCETMRVAGQTVPNPAQKAWPVDTLQMLLGNSQWWAHYSYEPKQKKTKKKEKVTSTITYIQ